MNVSPDLLSEFTRTLSAQTSDELPQRLCGAFAQVVGADGAAITVGSTPSARSLLAVTGRDAEELEDLQDMIGEGPSLRAMTGEGPAVLDAHAADTITVWPGLMKALLDHTTWRPPPALYAFPMRPQKSVLGVLTAHQHDSSGLKVGLEQAQFLANAIGVAVLGDFGSGSATNERWLARDRVSQATGMVVAQLGLSPEDALAVLRAHAYAHDAALSQVSSRVVDRSLRFAAPLEEGPS
ncbi:MAG: hypothetical protein JWN68_918 [Nocardioides sp.]|jgi:hypothetical protein|uniref:ANTAR domain-containing protein n=1 Tax=Nocardioides sp. TaxID=35761 RepID=UPI0026354259|nr:ANTAR domain-containing protein [Nocardioides sp.]MCW2832965.1 hypothetical protein [Nocardioides sp.]